MISSDTDTVRSIIKAAEQRGWTVRRLGESPDERRYYCISDNSGHEVWFLGGIPQTTSAVGARVAADKLRTLVFLRQSGHTVTPFLEYSDDMSAENFVQSNAPIVAKPLSGEQGRGVTVNIDSVDKLNDAVRTAKASANDGRVLLQKQLSGKEYRLLVVGNRLFAAAYRRPARVTGDGQTSVRELINALNEIRQSNSETSHLGTIDLSNVENHLGAEALDMVPAQDEVVEFSWLASMSLGGETQDVTDQVHPDYADSCVKISQALGLTICGFDFMTEDISKPMPDYFPLLEMNSSPGYKPHMYPTAGGSPRYPAEALLDYLWKDKQES